MDTLRLGTRGSELALFQANAVAALLREHARTASDIVVIKTSGDRLADGRETFKGDFYTVDQVVAAVREAQNKQVAINQP